MFDLLKTNFQENPWIVAIGASLIASLIWAIVVFLTYRLALHGIAVLEKGGQLPRLPNRPLQRILKATALITGSLLVLQQFGLLHDAWSTLSALLALIAIGFVAVWSVLSNALCSLIILIDRPFRIGDTVELIPDNLRGKVVDFRLLFTTLQDESGDWIQIPNNLFFQRAIRRKLGTGTISLEEQFQNDRPTEG